MLTTALVQTNVRWLAQAIALVHDLDDNTFRSSPADLPPHRVSGHLRHIIEFYECFLEGLCAGHIDYDARRRDSTVERSASAAVARLQRIIELLESLGADKPVLVRMEDADENSLLQSSLNRELQVLSSHTIHHFALIAVTLRAFGIAVPEDFGVAPSTLRYHASKAA